MPALKGNKYALNNKGGRPTKFQPRYINDIIEFFSVEPYKRELMEQSTEYFKEGSIKRKSEKFKHMPNKMPTLYQFSRKIGVDYTTILDWAEKGEDPAFKLLSSKDYTEEEIREIRKREEAIKEFSKSYKQAKELQKEFLITIGLAGAAPSSFAIFTAKNVTDMRDKTESDVTVRLPKPILDNISAKEIREIEVVKQPDALQLNDSNEENTKTE